MRASIPLDPSLGPGPSATPLVAAAAFVAVAVACAPASEQPASLRGEVLSRSDSLALPYKIAVHGDRLAVIDMGMERVLHVYDRESGRHRGSAMGRGDGPREVRSPWSLHLRAGHVCIWDFSHGKSICADAEGREPDDTAEVGEFTIDDPTLLREGVALIDVAIASDTLLVGVSYKKPGQLAVVNYRDARSLRFIPYREPPRPSSRVPRTVFLNGDLKMRPGTDQFVFAPRFGGEIFVGDLSGTVRRMEGPVPFSATEPRSDPTGPGGKAALRVGYISIDVTSEAVYGLFSGKQLGAILEVAREAMEGRELHVYDWDTRSWHTRKLDVPGTAIAVDEPYLYTIARETVPEIRAYRLESVLEPTREGARTGATATP